MAEISPTTARGGKRVERSTEVIDVSSVAPAGCNRLVMDVFVPEKLGPNPILWVCVPGGGINRQYFDLQVAGEADSFSMARFLASGGDLVVTIDPPGVGESDTPEDGFTLSPEVVASLLAAATKTFRSDLEQQGLPAAGLDPITPRAWIGLGHSAGALLVACQQAEHGSYDALALLGFSASGLPDVLNDAELQFVGRPAELRDAVGDLAKARFGEPLPQWSNSSAGDLAVNSNMPAIDAALASASSHLLALVGMTAIVPGSVQPQLDELRAPLFVGLGEYDLAGKLSALPAQLPACGDLTLFLLEGAGHNHNVAANRQVLWSRVTHWGHSLTD